MKPSVIFEMRCTKCEKKFISKIQKLAPCPYCGKLNDNVTRVVFDYIEKDGHVYVDTLTGKFLKPKTGPKKMRS
jgi:Zn finger protein HypA/HybF involved in hydrogenase expression